MTTRNSTVIESRLAQVRQQFDGWQVDGLLVSSATNRRWLSGFSGSAGQLLVTAGKAFLSTDFRYWEQAALQAPAFQLHQDQRTADDLADLVAAAGVKRIGFESDQVTVARREELAEAEGVQWVPLRHPLQPLRQVKSQDEIEAVRAAAGITDMAMAQVPRLAQPGISEAQLAWELEKLMRDQGATGLAFPVIAAFGRNSALPHHHPGERRLKLGDAIVVDMGAELNGYRSDLTRSFFMGSQPTEQFWTIYNLTLAAHTAVMENLRLGMNGREVDGLARDVISAGGFGDQFGHGLGHGVGLDIHEAPSLSFRAGADKTIMAAGMVVTVEPGIYLPDWGGVRIEDLILLTGNGVESLSRCPKSPAISPSP